MSRRKIKRNPECKLFYLIDANFLVNKFIPLSSITNAREEQRVLHSQEWWREIDNQTHSGNAMIYIPDVCIAEAFKVLAKKYYDDKYFKRPDQYKKARDLLSDFIHTNPRTLRASNRNIKVHDISTSRDVIIAVDRFNELYLKHKLEVSVVDLIILATAKYLIDFYHIPKDRLFIITLDTNLWKGSKKLTDIPSAFNPNHISETANKVFI